MTGVNVPHISGDQIRGFRFRLPPQPVQEKIVGLLSPVDDLVENSLRRIKILEEMARVLYEEWFVRFRFPGHEMIQMVESPLGLIPENWSCGVFGDICSISREAIQPDQFPGEVFAHYSFLAFDEAALPGMESGATMKSGKLHISGPCVLLAKLNPRIPRVWLPDLRDPERALASSEFLVLTAKEPATPTFLHAVCSSRDFAARFAGLAVGTSTSHQRVKPDDLLALPAIIPSADVIREFTLLARDFLGLVGLLRRTNHVLGTTREMLLQKLISGELDVSDLKIAGVETVEEVSA